jgi:hypothetical protein
MAVAALAVVLIAAPASVAAASPWSPLETGPFVAPAGTRCEFTLSGEVLSDKERIRTLETNSDGSPRVQEIVGELIIRYTNVETGEFVDRNLTGTALVEYLPDGGFTLSLVGGHMAVGLQPTDEGGPAFLVFTGAGHSVAFAADGTRTVMFGHGPVENLCETLVA